MSKLRSLGLFLFLCLFSFNVLMVSPKFTFGLVEVRVVEARENYLAQNLNRGQMNQKVEKKEASFLAVAWDKFLRFLGLRRDVSQEEIRSFEYVPGKVRDGVALTPGKGAESSGGNVSTPSPSPPSIRQGLPPLPPLPPAALGVKANTTADESSTTGIRWVETESLSEESFPGRIDEFFGGIFSWTLGK